MTEERDFLDAIADAPDDDDLRLIFADWLDERDDARGEYIRVQLDLARLPEDDPSRPGLERREKELLAKHLPRWLGPLWGPGIREVLNPRFRRGLLEHLDLEATIFLAAAADLFRLGPITSLRLHGVREHVRR